MNTKQTTIALLLLVLQYGCSQQISDAGPDANQSTSITVQLPIEIANGDSTIRWQPTENADSYLLEISGEDGRYNQLTLPAEQTSYTDPMLEPNVAYTYQLTALDNSGEAVQQQSATARLNSYPKMNSDEMN